MRSVCISLAFLLALAFGCERRGRTDAAGGPWSVASGVASAHLPVAAPSSAKSSASDVASSLASARPRASPPPPAATCRVLRGPIGLPKKVPASLVARGDSVLAIHDDDGHPRTLAFPAGAPKSGQGVQSYQALPDSCCAGPPIPCALASDRAFCADSAGLIHRASLFGADDQVVASARTGSRISAAELGEGHVALGYVASRKTTEGWVSEAWLAVDDGAPQRISEDGSGATSVSLLARSPGLLAIMVDARSALTAMHARTVSYRTGRAILGEDAVVFVGGPADRRTVASLAALPGGTVWSLLPIARDVQSFGLALARIHEPPRIDEPVIWSLYPNGLDAPPVAVAVSGSRIWVARVRPSAPEPVAPEVLELGEITDDGAFEARDTRSVVGHVTHVALTSDGAAALWLSWVDASGSQILRLACP